MAEDDDRLKRHEEMIEELRGLARQLAGWNQQQMVFNEEIKQLRERMRRGGDNGRPEA